jgi:hypothetical protein
MIFFLSRDAVILLTRDFRETIRARAERDPNFLKELVREAVETMVDGDFDIAKTILGDFINKGQEHYRNQR